MSRRERCRTIWDRPSQTTSARSPSAALRFGKFSGDLELTCASRLGDLAAHSEKQERFRTRLRASIHQLVVARLCTKPASYRAREKTGQSENRTRGDGVAEVQRCSPKQRHNRPKRLARLSRRTGAPRISGGGRETVFQHSPAQLRMMSRRCALIQPCRTVFRCLR